MRGHNICFHSEIRKIIFELSLIPLLIWSSAVRNPKDADAMANSEHPAPLTAVCSGSSLFSQTNRISHQSLIQTEKSQPEGKNG